MSVTYDALMNDTQLIQYTATASNTSLYPDSNTIAITGPIWLPRVYGKDLTAFEIASSGKIAISLNDIHTVDISRSNYIDATHFKNTIASQSNYSLDLTANSGALQITLDAYSNNIGVNAASNISLTAVSGNITISTSNNMVLSASNNYSLVTQSNVSLNASFGTATVSANNSNMYLQLSNNANTATLYSSNVVQVTACNTVNVNAQSNIYAGALTGDLKLYAHNSNMYVALQRSTDNITVYTSSNILLVSSNNTNITGKSNVSLGALAGDFQAYADGSNMFLTLQKSTDNATLYASNNVYISGSNDVNVNSQSNVFIGALGGDVKVYSQSSNMYMTFSASTNNISFYSSNNLNTSACNSINTNATSNISVSTVAGDYRLYVNNSNMFYRMSATTNNINVFSSNSTIISASNSVNVFAQSNMTVSTSNGSISLSANSSNMYQTMDAATNNLSFYSSNNTSMSASNTFTLNAQSNVYIGALGGDFKAYSDSSNMYLTMAKSSDTVTLYSASNMFVSASNTYNLNAKSNIYIGALAGDVRMYANSSNMFLVMDKSTNNISEFASNNMTVSVSNSLSTFVNSNISFSTIVGDYAIYANSSNMFLIMDHLSNNTTLFTSNNLVTGVSNNASIFVNSNYNISTIAGSYNVYANSSNMFMTMSSATNNVGVFSSNNTTIGASNNFSIFVNSNYNASTIAGSYNVYANSSNMFITMDSTTDNISLYAASNYLVSVSNSMTVDVKSNINMGTYKGDVTLSANSSNMSLIMDHVTDNITLYASSNIYVSSSNTLNVNAQSNIFVGALGGDFRVYSQKSNMFLTMDSSLNNITMFSSNNTNVSVSNSLTATVNSNVSIYANNGDMNLYANKSNVTIVMDRANNNMTLYASNSMNLTACNSYRLVTMSNVSLSATTGSLKLYSSTSNMSLVMDAATLNTTQFTSNNLNVTACNSYTLNTQSNIYVGALAGDFKAYSTGSNMYLTMEQANNNVTIFASNNLAQTASNTYTLNAQSNIYVGALAGGFKAYADSSNMYMTLDRTTDNATLYASSNIILVASNNINMTSKSNFTVGALAGSVQLYSDSSNMYLTMDRTTDNVSMYASNQMTLVASNSFTLNAQSNVAINANVQNMTFYASNNISSTASNSYLVNARSNIYVGALNGDFKVYSMSSNMYLVMDSATNNVSMFASNNFNISVSNSYNLITNSNLSASATNGDLKLYANLSNMFLTMDHTTNNTSLYTSNNLTVTASNSASLTTVSNITLAANTGSLKLYSTGSNMFITMDAATRNTTQYTSNNLAISASNNYTLNAQSNIYMGALGGDYKVYADRSNMYLTMTQATDNTVLYTSNNLNLSASNDFNLNAQSNAYVGALAGSFKAYADSSNMYVTLDRTTDNASMYASSNILIIASNNMGFTAKSNFSVGALAGSVKLYANSSNISVVLDQPTSNIVFFASNQILGTACNAISFTSLSNITLTAVNKDMTLSASNDFGVSACNNYTLNARSNVSLNASKGSFTAYANDSNMFLTMDNTNNNVALYAFKTMNLTASNNFNLNTQSNIYINAAAGEMRMYASSNLKLDADASNMFINMNMPSDVISIYSLSNIGLSASNVMFLEAMSNVQVTSSNINFISHRDFNIVASNNITISASNTLTFNFGTTNSAITIGNDQSFTSQSNMSFYIQSAPSPTDPVFEVRNSNILIRGDIVVTGSINTSNVFSTTVVQESLKIEDKVVTLASIGSNFSPGDGPTDGVSNDGAGVVIDGVPLGYDSNIPQAYDKTFKWNYGTNGIASLGTSNVDDESYWEVKGGSFHLTHQKIIPSGGSNIVQNVSIIFRVNENDELELCKTFWYAASNAYITKRLAKFGKML